ncbi:MAG: hypothetical protein Q8S29_03670 [Phreatobacter sp.]|nr:hypothetical protein [Phreatobacter sp.]
MTRIVWWGALVGAAFWSVFAFLAYAVVDTVGVGASSYGTVPGFPPEPFTFAWIAARAHGLGVSSIAAVWLIGLAMIFGSAALFHRLFGRRSPSLPPAPRSWGSSIPSGNFNIAARPTLKQRLFGR